MKITNAKPFFPSKDIDSILNDIKDSLRTGVLTFGPNVLNTLSRNVSYVLSIFLSDSELPRRGGKSQMLCF